MHKLSIEPYAGASGCHQRPGQGSGGTRPTPCSVQARPQAPLATFCISCGSREARETSRGRDAAALEEKARVRAAGEERSCHSTAGAATPGDSNPEPALTARDKPRPGGAELCARANDGVVNGEQIPSTGRSKCILKENNVESDKIKLKNFCLSK